MSTPTCFGTKVPSSGSLYTTDDSKSKTHFGCQSPSIPKQKLKVLKCYISKLQMLTSTIPYCCNNNAHTVTSPYCYTFAVVGLKFGMT